MKSIFRLFIPKIRYKPPHHVSRSLESHFGKILNVEWNNVNDHYEALFYFNAMECIALFDETGLLLESKFNLPLHMVKAEIASQALAVGELMNLIEIRKDGKVYYEIIARDKMLDRFFLLLEEDGKLIEKRKL